MRIRNSHLYCKADERTKATGITAGKESVRKKLSQDICSGRSFYFRDGEIKNHSLLRHSIRNAVFVS